MPRSSIAVIFPDRPNLCAAPSARRAWLYERASSAGSRHWLPIPMRHAASSRQRSPVSANRLSVDRTRLRVPLPCLALVPLPGCGMGPVLAQDVQNKLLSVEEIEEANVELVWDPPWNQGMMTDAARLQLGLM